jgi:raffinose/stachyose/melibiose transport system substrate-binding protein
MQNEDFQTKIPLALNSDSPPDLYQSWAGGVLAEQVAAGKVMDITDLVAPWIDTINPGAASVWQVDGRQYGIPYDLGVVGMWYNKDLFSQAGIEAPPATWADLLAAIGKLKDAGITPIAVGEGDPWTGAFWWEYLALRLCGPEKMLAAVKANVLDDQCFVDAGVKFQELLATEPFQDGFLATPAQTGADSASSILANERAAMELMGQWEPAVMVPLTDPAGGLPLEKLGWFPFPAVEGGAGAITDYIGGGDGFAVSASAPPETVELLKYLVSSDVATKWATDANGLPVTVGTEGAVTDPNMAELIQNRADATFVQLYLDQAFPAAVGAAVNEAVQGLFAGALTPEQVVENINAVAATS